MCVFGTGSWFLFWVVGACFFVFGSCFVAGLCSTFGFCNTIAAIAISTIRRGKSIFSIGESILTKCGDIWFCVIYNHGTMTLKVQQILKAFVIFLSDFINGSLGFNLDAASERFLKNCQKTLYEVSNFKIKQVFNF